MDEGEAYFLMDPIPSWDISRGDGSSLLQSRFNPGICIHCFLCKSLECWTLVPVHR